jgi:hypothetical protein
MTENFTVVGFEMPPIAASSSVENLKHKGPPSPEALQPKLLED